ncbi:serine/threonine protein kinase, partial [Streptomyces sp. SID7982]|nr:serine/threonine protein kinase [Streptomyces sp. SID7982]
PTTYGIPAPDPAPPRELGGAYALPAARTDADVQEYADADVQDHANEYADYGSREGWELPVPPLPQGYAPRRDDDGYAPYDLPPGREADPVPEQRADGQEIVPRPAAPA